MQTDRHARCGCGRTGMLPGGEFFDPLSRQEASVVWATGRQCTARYSVSPRQIGFARAPDARPSHRMPLAEPLPNPSKAVRVMSTRPACRSRPSSQITTSAKVRWMSIPITRLTISSLPIEEKGAWGSRQLRIRAHSATGQVAEAASYKLELAAHRIRSACPHFVLPVPLSRRVAPYAGTTRIPAGQKGTADLHTGYKRNRVIERQIAPSSSRPRPFPHRGERAWRRRPTT